MPTNLINQLLGEFRGDTLNRVSSVLGESPAKTQSALGAAVPALVAGLANKVTTAGDASALLDLIKGNHFDSGPYTDTAAAVALPSGLSGLIDTGKPLLDSVFGSRTSSVADWISSLGGISRSAASSLLGLALPLVLGQVGRHVKSAGWNSANLMSLLAGQRSFLQEAPAGLAGVLSGDEAPRLVGTYETSRVEPVVASYDRTQRPPVVGTYQQAVPRRGFNWAWLLPLLLIPLAYFLTRGEPAREFSATVVNTERSSPPAVKLGSLVERRLPNDTTLRIPSNGVESKLLASIENITSSGGKATWLSFDRIEFDSDSATLTQASTEQLRNVAEIMKAYPQVKVKIGGYTDNAADASYNLKLSQERATNTMNQIASLGIDQSRLSAEGYGENNPIADNTTEEGRQRNRRVDISVTER